MSTIFATATAIGLIATTLLSPPAHSREDGPVATTFVCEDGIEIVRGTESSRSPVRFTVLKGNKALRSYSFPASQRAFNTQDFTQSENWQVTRNGKPCPMGEHND